MIKWIKKLREIVSCHKELMRIVGGYDSQYKWLRSRMVEATDLIKSRTEISADVHFTGQDRNQIIVTGRYRNADYVQVFTIPDNELRHLIETLRDMERFGVVDKVDAPYQMKEKIMRDLQL